MQSTWQMALQLVLAHEGGYVDNPLDKGGPTNKGVTQRIYDAYRKSNNQPLRNVAEISDLEVQYIYGQQYWDHCGAKVLPAGVDYAVFDYAVHSGVAQAVKDLQREVGAPVDGVFGKVTLALVQKKCEESDVALIESYCARRMVFLQSLKSWKTFGKGWENRVLGDGPLSKAGHMGVVDYALMIAQKDMTYPIMDMMLPTTPAPAKALPTDTKPTAMGVGLAVAGAGVAGQTVMVFAEQVKPFISETPVGKFALVVFLALMGAGGLLTAGSHLVRLKEQLCKGIIQ